MRNLSLRVVYASTLEEEEPLTVPDRSDVSPSDGGGGGGIDGSDGNVLADCGGS